MKKLRAIAGISLVMAFELAAHEVVPVTTVLKADLLRSYVTRFNAEDNELYSNAIPNAKAADFLEKNIPLFDCPDEDFLKTYYFRWWVFRKHISETPDGYVITEFLPKVHWSGKHNAISCPAGHHFYEGRWLRDPKYLNDYAHYWFRKGGSPRSYSFWAADAIHAMYLVKADKTFATDLLDDLITNYQEWEKARMEPDGLFWQIDDRDGMEHSIAGEAHRGQGKRTTINSYLFGDALAIAALADLAKRDELAMEYRAKAEQIRKRVLEKLWDPDAQFFKVLPRGDDAKLADVRELHGFTPWYFNLPPKGKDYEVAWHQLMDPQGFHAPYGLTTAEQRHPKYKGTYQSGANCQWNGPSWPFASSVTLTALANVLNHYPQHEVSNRDYFDTLKIYTLSQRLKREDDTVVPWIDESLDPNTGDWYTRTVILAENKLRLLKGKPAGPLERGKDYNHSTYCDLIISGLVGLRPQADHRVVLNPLLPRDTWDWFCLDRVSYHGHTLTIIWDKTGEHYDKGKGLTLFINGKRAAQSNELGLIQATLPSLTEKF